MDRSSLAVGTAIRGEENGKDEFYERLRFPAQDKPVVWGWKMKNEKARHLLASGRRRGILTGAMMILILGASADLAAEKKGAILRLELLDGRRLQGELLSVKGERLILQGSRGAGEEIGIRDIVRLRIGRRKAVGRRVVTGIVAGFVAGSITFVVLTDEHIRSEWGLVGGVLCGGCGAGIGGAIGAGAGFAARGRDEVYPREKSELWVAGLLKRLRRLARFRDETSATVPAARM